MGLAVDAFGDPHIAVTTSSANLPVTAEDVQARLAGKTDVYLAKFSRQGWRLLYATYYGGSGEDSAGYDGGSLKVDDQGRLYLAGFTDSADLPTETPVQRRFGGGDADGFVAVIDSRKSALEFATYVGGSGRDLLEGLSISSQGGVWASGLTASRDLLTTGGLQPAHGGGMFDAMVIQISQIIKTHPNAR